MNSLFDKKPLVWFITGTSQGFGRELVRAALQRGDSVVATSRQPEIVAAAFPDASDRLLGTLDLHDPAQIARTVATAVSRFGRIDVLINNAGHGLLSAVEEASDAEPARSGIRISPALRRSRPMRSSKPLLLRIHRCTFRSELLPSSGPAKSSIKCARNLPSGARSRWPPISVTEYSKTQYHAKNHPLPPHRRRRRTTV